MAQVAILVNGSADPRKTQVAATLGLVLGCPVLTPATVQEALLAQVGPVAPRTGIRNLAAETVWRTARLVEAGVVIDATWQGDEDARSVETGLVLAGAPRLVEVWCSVGARPADLAASDGGRTLDAGPSDSTAAEAATAGKPLGLTPLVSVDTTDEVDMDALVVEISALFV